MLNSGRVFTGNPLTPSPAAANSTMSLPFLKELIVDLFAGGGGASKGISRAYREPDVAVNHNAVALAVHRANHPTTDHYVSDVFEVDPIAATGGNPVGLLWASADCRHFSRAKGGKPLDKKVRGLAWVIIRWAFATRPRLVISENVLELTGWGPLDDKGKPIKSEQGRTFKAFISALTTGIPVDHPDIPEILDAIGNDVPVEALVKGLGYQVEWRERIAANAGARTIRKRLYLIARSDGKPIVWPEPSRHKTGIGDAQWRGVDSCIDWSDLGKSVFRARPLAYNTNRRIAKGFWRHVIQDPQPFIVPLRGTSASHTSTHSLTDPLSTISAGGTHHALVSPEMQPHRIAAGSIVTLRKGTVGRTVDKPLSVITTNSGHHAVTAAHMTHLSATGDMGGASSSEAVAAFLEQANGGFYKGDGRAAKEPISTICGSGANQRLVGAYFARARGAANDESELVDIPDVLTDEQRAAAKRCAQYLHAYLPEQFPEAAEMILIGQYVLVDITLRMLQPEELKRAQGFPDDYIIDRGLFVDEVTGLAVWKSVSKTNQVKLIGNSVCPDEAEALVRANAADEIELYQKLAA